MRAPFHLTPTGASPRIFVITFQAEPGTRPVARATLALDVDMSPKQIAKWRTFVEAALNTAYQLAQELPQTSAGGDLPEGMRVDPSGLQTEGEQPT